MYLKFVWNRWESNKVIASFISTFLIPCWKNKIISQILKYTDTLYSFSFYILELKKKKRKMKRIRVFYVSREGP